MNRPSRTDYYLMQIAAEVRRVLSTKPNEIKDEHFKIEFVEKKPEPPLTKEEEAKRRKEAGAIAASVWMARLGQGRRRK